MECNMVTAAAGNSEKELPALTEANVVVELPIHIIDDTQRHMRKYMFQRLTLLISEQRTGPSCLICACGTMLES